VRGTTASAVVDCRVDGPSKQPRPRPKPSSRSPINQSISHHLQSSARAGSGRRSHTESNPLHRPPWRVLQHRRNHLAPTSKSRKGLNTRGRRPLVPKLQHAPDRSLQAVSANSLRMTCPMAGMGERPEATRHSGRSLDIIYGSKSVGSKKEGTTRMDGQTRAVGIPRDHDANPNHTMQQQQHQPQRANSHPKE